jgi:hypothetical protein
MITTAATKIITPSMAAEKYSALPEVVAAVGWFGRHVQRDQRHEGGYEVHHRFGRI